MTETMLEKSAAAIWEEFCQSGDPLFSELPPSARERLSNIARAALRAIREPDKIVAGVIEYGVPRDGYGDPEPGAGAEAWREAIDAILNEKPNG